MKNRRITVNFLYILGLVLVLVATFRIPWNGRDEMFAGLLLAGIAFWIIATAATIFGKK